MKNGDGNGTLYLLMLDGDLFKNINDQYGHNEGDKALIRIAGALKEAGREIRKRCVISRFGGDEFTIVCEISEQENIEGFCNLIRSSLAHRNLLEQAPYDLTVSIGYAEYDPGIYTVREFIERADEKLYEVKKNRRR